MSVLDIIRIPLLKGRERTEKELRTAYRILYHADKTVTNMFKYEDVENFNETLDNLLLVSKSRLMGIRYCPFQIKMGYIIGLKSPETRVALDGSNIHLINKIFWNNKVKIKDFMRTNNIRKMMYRKYIELIEPDERSPFILKMADKFIGFETRRITQIYDEVGKTKEATERYVFPVANELMIENWELHLMGIIDRMDRLTNETFGMIEYKTGKPHYLEKANDKTNINTEVGFYGLLLQGNPLVVSEDKKGEAITTPLEDVLGFKPLFYYGCMLYLQDVKQTAVLFQITKRLLNTTMRQINDYWNRIDKGQFQPKPSNACQQWCDYYWDLCEVNPEWLAIENAMVGK